MEGGMVAVDRWSDGSQAYFLTHLHTDHTRGLSPSWKRGPLFCSRTTAKLLPFNFPGFDVSSLRVVDLGTWYSLSLRSPSTGSASVVEFVAIDALHCPGTVLSLSVKVDFDPLVLFLAEIRVRFGSYNVY